MREMSAATLPDRATITGGGALTEVPDGFGGFTLSGGASVNDVPCRYVATAASESVVAGAIQALKRYVVTFPAGTLIKASYTITIAARDDKPQMLLNVTDELKRTDNVAVRVVATEVE